MAAKQLLGVLVIITIVLCVINLVKYGKRTHIFIGTLSFMGRVSTDPLSASRWDPLSYAKSTRMSQTPSRRLQLANLSDTDRCAEIRRRVSRGVVDYALQDGDPELLELVKPIFTKRRLVVWSADHHIGPISDLRSLLEPLGVEFLEHTLYPVCDIMCTCEQLHSTKVLTAHNILHLSRPVIERFWTEYQRDADINRADALLVSYSFSMIELYLRYNKSIIAIAPLRYEISIAGDKARWSKLNDNLRQLSADERHVVGANNLYDWHYMRYFTGISALDYVPSFCAYTGEFYGPTRPSFLYAERRFGLQGKLGPYWHSKFSEQYKRVNANFTIDDYRKKYKRFYYSDIASHLGIVYIPYQVSLMSFFEQYRMNIPLFAPSLPFLVALHREYYAVYDRTIAGGYSPSARGSRLPPHLSMAHVPDPNDDFSDASASYWLPLSDFYHFANVTYFESVEQLVDILHSIRLETLYRISDAMRAHNRNALKEILRYWRLRLIAIAHFSPFHPE